MRIKYEDNKITAIIGYENTFQVSKNFFLVKSNLKSTKSVKDYLKSSDKLSSALTMVGLEVKILGKNINDLSKSEQILIQIVKYLLSNRKKLYLHNILSCLDQKHLNKVIKILKKISHKYNHTVIIFDLDMNLIYEVGDIFYLPHLNRLITKPELQKNTSIIPEEYLPETIIFVNYLKQNPKFKVNYYLELNDLAKGIFRND